MFARAPVPGRAKTRLIPMLDPLGAAKFQAALILDTTCKVDRLGQSVERWLFVTGGRIPVNPGGIQWTRATQRGRDLGERLDHAFTQLLRGHRAAVIIGTDSPSLSSTLLRQALSELRVCDAVLGPCPDGGFYVIGLRRLVPNLFRAVRWSSSYAFRDMLQNLLGNGYSCSVMRKVSDVDRPEDLKQLARQMTRSGAARRSSPAVWRFLTRAGLAH